MLLCLGRSCTIHGLTEIVIFILKEKSHFDHLSDLVVRDAIGELVVDPTGCSNKAGNDTSDTT
jgi:hypothetical protein